MRTIAIILAAAAVAGGAAPARASRAVSLSDARFAPTHLSLLRPHRATTLDDWQCGRHAINGSPSDRFYSEVSAYQWNGNALGRQRWNSDHTVTYWGARTGRVTFDGLTFRNHTRRTVLVAGWCDE